ncbi:DUF4145 domain-containing protein [Aeromonas veronii]|uniref:DUF4145 domain-containing protein n=1 Tax=Aeromonas veronii TaxID=654 RepID=UPI003BA3169A
MLQPDNQELNKSANTELLIACPQCTGRTKHTVVLSVDQSGYVEDNDVHWSASYQIIRCKGCDTLSFRHESSNSDEYEPVDENHWITLVREELFPSRIEGRKDLGPDVVYLPPDLRRVYAETNQALNNDSPVLAGIGLRALVETVCKEKDAEGRDLSSKINDLKDKHVLTPTGASILHKVRTLGNQAAHEVKPHSPQQLALAMSVVEHMLKDVYILPQLVKNQFE